MRTLISTINQPLVEQVPGDLSALITMPFEPKLYGGKKLEQRVSQVINKATRVLTIDYFSSQIKPLIDRLHIAFRGLNYHTFTRSLAVFITPSAHRILYLNLPLKEEIVINRFVNLRDILRLKQQQTEYLVLVLNDQWAKTYLGNQSGIKLLKADRPLPAVDRKVNGKKIIDGKKAELSRLFYKKITDDFVIISKAFQVPVFVMGSQEKAGFFYDSVSSRKDIVQVIYHNTDDIREHTILQTIQPYLRNWRVIKQRYLRRQLQEASIKNRVTAGIEAVSRNIKNGVSKRLLIEESYVYPNTVDAQHIVNVDGQVQQVNHSVQERLDEIIENILLKSGEVEVVPDGFLKDHGRIAMMDITYDEVFNYKVFGENDLVEIF